MMNKLLGRKQDNRWDLFNGGLCLITDRESCDLTCMEMAQIALQSGVKWIQLRDKDRDRICLYRSALQLRKVTREYGAVLVVNDFADIAAAVDADGVHLGQDDLPVTEARKIMGPDRIIGISTHTMDEAVQAEMDGADYIGFGPIFDTSTKDAGQPRGTSHLSEVSRAVAIPVVAIGGISTGSFEKVIRAGADAVAMASGLLKGEFDINATSVMGMLQGSA